MPSSSPKSSVLKTNIWIFEIFKTENLGFFGDIFKHCTELSAYKNRRNWVWVQLKDSLFSSANAATGAVTADLQRFDNRRTGRCERTVPQSVGKPASGAAVQAEIAGQNWARDETTVVFEAMLVRQRVQLCTVSARTHHQGCIHWLNCCCS